MSDYSTGNSEIRSSAERLSILKDSIILGAVNGAPGPAPPALLAYLGTLQQVERDWIRSYLTGDNDTEGVGRLTYLELQTYLGYVDTCRSFLATLAQHRGHSVPTGEVVTNMIPKMAPFNGKVDKGFTFLELSRFKLQVFLNFNSSKHLELCVDHRLVIGLGTAILPHWSHLKSL